MAQQKFTVFQVKVNNEVWKTVPNTLVYLGGEGETNIQAASIGGGESESVHSINAEDKLGGCTFEIYPTPDADDKIRFVNSNTGNNVIECKHQTTVGGTEWHVRTFVSCSLQNHPERNATADGTISCEFKGDQMLIA